MVKLLLPTVRWWWSTARSEVVVEYSPQLGGGGVQPAVRWWWSTARSEVEVEYSPQ